MGPAKAGHYKRPMTLIEFGRLYERYAGDVLRFALYLTGDRSEAAWTVYAVWLAHERRRAVH